MFGESEPTKLETTEDNIGVSDQSTTPDAGGFFSNSANRLRTYATIAASIGALALFQGCNDDKSATDKTNAQESAETAGCAAPSESRKSDIRTILTKPVTGEPAQAFASANSLTIKSEYTFDNLIEDELDWSGKPVSFNAMLRRANIDLKTFGVTLSVAKQDDKLPEGLRAPTKKELDSEKTAAVLDAIDNSVSTLPVEYVRGGGPKKVILASSKADIAYAYPTKSNTTIAYNLSDGPDLSSMPGFIYQVYDDMVCEDSRKDHGFTRLHNAKNHSSSTGLLYVNDENGYLWLMNPEPFNATNDAIDRENIADFCKARKVVADENIQIVFGPENIENDKRSVASLFNFPDATRNISGPDTDAPILREKLVFLLARLPKRYGTYFAKLNARYKNPKKEVMPLNCN